MTKKGLKLLFAAIVIVILNAGLFTFSSISFKAFWISWVFIHIAFVIFICVMIFSVPEQKQLIFGYSETAVTTYYFIIELVAGIVLVFQFAFFPTIVFAVQLIILVGYILAFGSTKVMNKNIEREENVKNVEMFHFNSMLESMKDVQKQIEYVASYRKTVEHAYDAIASSPVKSVEEARETERQISELIMQLKQNVLEKNEAEILSICTEIERAVEKRNREIRLNRR